MFVARATGRNGFRVHFAEKKKKVHRKQREELGVTKFHRSTAITNALVRVNTFPESRSRHRHVGNTIRKVKTQKRTRLTFGRPCTCTLFFRKNKKQETIMQHETKPHEFDSNSTQRYETHNFVGTISRTKRIVHELQQCTHHTAIYVPPWATSERCIHTCTLAHTHTHAHAHIHTHIHTRIQKPKARTISIREIRSEKKNERKRGKKGKKGIDA